MLSLLNLYLVVKVFAFPVGRLFIRLED